MSLPVEVVSKCGVVVVALNLFLLLFNIKLDVVVVVFWHKTCCRKSSVILTSKTVNVITYITNNF